MAMSTISDTVQHIDLLTILLGRMLQIQVGDDENAASTELEEIKTIATYAKKEYVVAADDEVKEAALDILIYLPVRSADEITFVIRFAEAAIEEPVQKACALAVECASGNTPEKKDVLEAGKASPVGAVRDAVKFALE